MSIATIFSLPTYVPDPTSAQTVAGYAVQSLAPAANETQLGTWTAITGSPFASPNNIVDPSGTQYTWYRAAPVISLPGGYTMDVPWSRPFLATDPLFDTVFTYQILPAMRFTYLHDEGKFQSNATVLTETTGAGQGLFVPDGTTTKFPLQWVINDDPIKVLDSVYTLTYEHPAGTLVALVEDTDWRVDTANGYLEFAVAPAGEDYFRFDFRMVDFRNADLYDIMVAGVNSLSHFGINGFQMQKENNLLFLNRTLPNPDLIELICKIGVWQMREGQTEAGLRSSFAWRDGGVNTDPYPSRALEFLVQKIQVTEKTLHNQCNNYIRGVTRPRVRGEFDITFDMSQMTPLHRNMFAQFASTYGAGYTQGFMYPWWI